MVVDLVATGVVLFAPFNIVKEIPKGLP